MASSTVTLEMFKVGVSKNMAGFRATPIQLNPIDPEKAARTIIAAREKGKIDTGYIISLITALAKKVDNFLTGEPKGGILNET